MPEALYFTESDEANRLIASEPLALLVGFAIDQQITVQQAFSGPLKLQERIGTLDARSIAAMDPAALEAAFRQTPAIHRFPRVMAERVQELCQVVTEEFDGDAARIWSEASDAADLRKRIGALPGFGDMKVRSLVATLIKQFGVKPDGWEQVLPSHPTLGDADTPEALAAYQTAKREHKRQVRAQRERKE